MSTVDAHTPADETNELFVSLLPRWHILWNRVNNGNIYTQSELIQCTIDYLLSRRIDDDFIDDSFVQNSMRLHSTTHNFSHIITFFEMKLFTNFYFSGN